MRIRDEYLRSVAFVSRGGESIDFRGTVFFVLLNDGGKVFTHIVTAAHVARQLEGFGRIIGFNGQDGGTRLVSLDNLDWFYHPTEADSVDVAVMLFTPGRDHDFDVRAADVEMFVSDEQIVREKIGLGDEVYTIGLFTKFFGISQMSPIVRTGNIAMMPKDKIALKGCGDAEVYLIEGRSIGGLSGSPVFWRESIGLTVTTANGQPGSLEGLGKFGLLGLIHGHWDLSLDREESEQKEAVNMGISIVVPAKKILETLNHPDLVELRRSLALEILELERLESARPPQ